MYIQVCGVCVCVCICNAMEEEEANWGEKGDYSPDMV